MNKDNNHEAINDFIQKTTRKRGNPPSYSTVRRWCLAHSSEPIMVPPRSTVKRMLGNAAGSYSVLDGGKYLSAVYKAIGVFSGRQEHAGAARLAAIWTNIIIREFGYCGSDLLFKAFGGRRETYRLLRSQLIAMGMFVQVQRASANCHIVARFEMGPKHPDFGTVWAIMPPQNAWEAIDYPYERLRELHAMRSDPSK